VADFADLEERIQWLSAQAASRSDVAMLSEMEVMLSEGYVRALMAEGRMKQLDQQLQTLMASRQPDDTEQIRSIARERRQIARRVERLRARLAVMRDGFVALRVAP
jgi:c-di-GMP-binding flagellar brake protein YcgR